MRKAFPLVLIVTGLIATGCGDSSDSTSGAEAEETSVSADEAIDQIGAVRNGLAASLTAYRNGDEEQAEELASDAYLEHFELVEGPLEKADEELNEELEEQIREELRDLIRDGAPVTKVTALLKKINGELDEAEKALSS